MIALVHAQIFSTSRVLRSRWTEVSRGDCIFPCAFFNLVSLQKQEERQKGCDGAVLLESGRAYLLQQLLRRSADCRKAAHHEKLCSVRSTLLAGSETRAISAPRRPTQRVRYRRVQKRARGRISPRALSIFVEFVLNAGIVNIRVQAIGART